VGPGRFVLVPEDHATHGTDEANVAGADDYCACKEVVTPIDGLTVALLIAQTHGNHHERCRLQCYSRACWLRASRSRIETIRDHGSITRARLTVLMTANVAPGFAACAYPDRPVCFSRSSADEPGQDGM